MPNSLEFDATTLQHFDYHWFWGLCYRTTPKPKNMSAEVMRLLEDGDKLTYIETRQQTLERHPAVVRFFYWLFNLENYAYHAYLLFLHKAHQHYLDDVLNETGTMEEKKMNRSTIFGFTWFAFSGWSFYRLLKKGLQSPLQNTIEEESKDTSSMVLVSMPPRPSEVRRARPSEINGVSLVVTDLMVSSLKVLGIHLAEGEVLYLTEIKSAYKVRVLQVHPDKGGSKEEFCCLHNATEYLIKEMSSLTRIDLNKYWADFAYRVDKLMSDLSEIEQQHVAIGNQHVAIRNQHVELRSQLSALKSETAATNARSEKIEARMALIEQKMGEQADRAMPSRLTTRRLSLFVPAGERMREADLSLAAEENTPAGSP